MLYNYIIGKNAKGRPTLNKPTPIPTTECNGTTVWFDLIEPEDFELFKEGIKHQLKYFRTIITKGFDFDNDYHIYQGKHFTFRPDRKNVDGLEICWGNIYYPIDWVALKMPKIDINCAIYFPTNTALDPTISREGLKNLPHILAMIKDKIHLMQEELKELWKGQQIVDDFFTWIHKDTKTIDFGNGILDVTSLIKDSYIYRPLIGTHIDSIILKKNYKEFLRRGFEYTRKKSSGVDPESIGNSSSTIYYTERDMSPFKLSRVENGWQACIRRRRPLETNLTTLLPCLYPDEWSERTFNIDLNKWMFLGPMFNYKKEAADLIEEVWKNVKKNVRSLDEIELVYNPKHYTFAGDEQVRGRFGGSSDTEVWTLEEIAEYRFIVYTEDNAEYRALHRVTLPDAEYLCISCAKKYFDKLSSIDAMSYKEFIASSILDKAYVRQHRKNYAEQYLGSKMSAYIALHPMYTEKFKHEILFADRNSYQGVEIPPLIMKDLAKKLTTWTEYLEKERSIMDKTLQDARTEWRDVQHMQNLFRYKKLYETYKKKCTRLVKTGTIS